MKTMLTPLQVAILATVTPFVVAPSITAEEPVVPRSWTVVDDPGMLPPARIVQLGESPWRAEIRFVEPEAVRQARENRPALRPFLKPLVREDRMLLHQTDEGVDEFAIPDGFESLTSARINTATGVIDLQGQLRGQPGIHYRFYKIEPDSRLRLILGFRQGRIPNAPGTRFAEGWLDERHYMLEGGVRLTVEEELERRQDHGILLEQGINTDTTPYKHRYLYIFDVIDEVEFLHEIDDLHLKRSSDWILMSPEGWHDVSILLGHPREMLRARGAIRFFRADLEPTREAGERPEPEFKLPSAHETRTSIPAGCDRGHNHHP